MSEGAELEHKPIGRSVDNLKGIQLDSQQYYTPAYLSPRRLSSYGYQYSLAYNTKSNSFLNIGSANKLLTQLLTTQKRKVIDLDIDLYTSPNLVGSLPNLPINDKAFDVVMCFQVLEHLPFQVFSNCISEFSRIAREYILVSLPDTTLSVKQKAKTFFYKFFKHPSEWGIYRYRTIHREHFWELGQNNITTREIINLMNIENVVISRHFRNKYYYYHHFFVLKVVK